MPTETKAALVGAFFAAILGCHDGAPPKGQPDPGHVVKAPILEVPKPDLKAAESLVLNHLRARWGDVTIIEWGPNLSNSELIALDREAGMPEEAIKKEAGPPGNPRHIIRVKYADRLSPKGTDSLFVVDNNQVQQLLGSPDTSENWIKTTRRLLAIKYPKVKID
jgi:hypothetical protein